VCEAAHRLPEWRERLRTLPAGTKLAIDYRRDGKPAKAELMLADRIPERAALSK
jgi:S1-C subfamily serine protease